MLIGDNEITAVYDGDTTYSSSKSAAQDLVLSDSDDTTPFFPSDPIIIPSDPITDPSDPIIDPSD